MRTLILLAVVMAALVAPKAASASPRALVSALVTAQSKADDEDEDDPAPGAKTPAPTPGAKPDAAKPEASKPAAAAAPAKAETKAPSEATKLVSGAPLNNPNVAVHTVEQKQFSDSGKRELVLYPATVQVNGKFSQHYGTMGSFLWYLQEHFAVMLTGGYNWFNSESAFTDEIQSKLSVAPNAAAAVLSTWNVMGGVEVAPLYGKFAIFENALVSFSFVVNGGAGAGGTRVQLRAAGTVNGRFAPAAFGETTPRFNAYLGAGFRLALGSRFALRLELRDVVYTARVESINGCNSTEISALQSQGMRATVSGACRRAEFEGVDEYGQARSANLSLASKLLASAASDVLNNVSMFLGASFIF